MLAPTLPPCSVPGTPLADTDKAIELFPLVTSREKCLFLRPPNQPLVTATQGVLRLVGWGCFYIGGFDPDWQAAEY